MRKHEKHVETWGQETWGQVKNMGSKNMGSSLSLSHALAAGAKELSPMGLRSWGHLAAYCLDPDGHVLAFAMGVP